MDVQLRERPFQNACLKELQRSPSPCSEELLEFQMMTAADNLACSASTYRWKKVRVPAHVGQEEAGIQSMKLRDSKKASARGRRGGLGAWSTAHLDIDSFEKVEIEGVREVLWASGGRESELSFACVLHFDVLCIRQINGHEDTV